MRLNALAEKLQFSLRAKWDRTGKSPSHRKVCAADHFWRRGLLDVRFVVRHRRSLAEGSSALERLLAGGQRVRSCAARKRK